MDQFFIIAHRVDYPTFYHDSKSLLWEKFSTDCKGVEKEKGVSMFEDHCAKLRMVSPTGLGIRNDIKGSGYYRAKRGKKLHKGTDYQCRPGQEVVAPFSGKIKRIAKPYAKEDYSGVVLENEFLTAKLFYFVPHNDIIGQSVLRGQGIGIAQDISKKYGDKMTPHIHFQIDQIDPNIFVRR